MCLHACDLSTPTRNFDTLKKWTYLLFEEFFEQGDVEKNAGMPASFLCDRETTVIAKEQPGFINFIVAPLWKHVGTILPNMGPACEKTSQNSLTWKSYVETEEDKKVYKKKELPDVIMIGSSSI